MSANSQSNATSQQPVAGAAAQTGTATDFHIYRPPQSSPSEPTRELPESYFTPTTADLKAAQASLTARAQALVNAPLQTQAMRDAAQKVRLAKYPTVRTSPAFTDRTQLEKTFPSTDKIRSVYAFVRSSLREDVKPIKFVLFQTPPKRELKVSDPKVRDQTLLQLQLAPNAILHLLFEDESLNHVTVPAPLAPEVLAKAEDLPIPPDYTSAVTSERSSGASTPTRTASSAGSKPTDKVKVPKWLKLGPNK
ncbi:hypothetical protein NM688_g357 [Phlebia brevispora]|uniref:Uncharacterized protein n=1 Tax=Phlebia brevispora TaxID=194682 RepID=A0ACC1TEU9_9APHY|nr:hypothetical protein NM688_g357 [Phlebia brevispora]